jgi:hypothetical protein
MMTTPYARPRSALLWIGTAVLLAGSSGCGPLPLLVGLGVAAGIGALGGGHGGGGEGGSGSGSQPVPPEPGPVPPATPAPLPPSPSPTPSPSPSPPPAATLVFTAQPADTTAGSKQASVQVSVENAAGQLEASFTGVVTVALTQNSGPLLYGTVTKNAVNGVATFSDLLINKPGNYQLQASASGTSVGTSAPFGIAARAPALPCATSPDFAASRVYPVGNSPIWVASVDIDGDGILDLVAANEDGTVSILHGLGGGYFGNRTTISVGSTPWELTVADLNGDGKPDIVVAQDAGSSVAVLFQSSTTPGAFLSPMVLPAGTNPNSVVVADMNGDGLPDIVVANNGSANVSLILQDSTNPGTFLSAIQIPVGSAPRSVAVADLNGDGRPDIVVADFGSGQAWVILHDTTPTGFLAPVGYACGSSTPAGVAIGDLNGDGRPDFVICDYESNTMSVFLQNSAPAPAGTFAARAGYTVGSWPSSVRLADMNGDGNLDIVTVDQASDQLSILLNDPSNLGTFLPSVQYPAGGRASGVAVGDFAGDGRMDVATANISTNDVWVLMAEPTAPATFPQPPSLATGTNPRFVISADLNGDGLSDLVVTNQSGNTVSVILGNLAAPGTFLSAVDYATGSGPSGAAIADVNGDGAPDIVVPNLYDGTVQVFLQDTANPGTLLTPTTYTLGSNPAFIVVADFNHDGVPDLAVATDSNDKVAILLQNPASPGTFLSPTYYAAGAATQFLALGDFNGDGWLDLAACGPDNGQASVVVILADPNNPGAFLGPTDCATGSAPMSVVTADLNGDGKLDLAVSSRDSNNVTVLLGKGDGTFNAGVAFPTSANAWDVQVADMNADGRPDLVVAEYGAGTIYVLLQDPGNPGSFVPGPRYSVGGNPSWLCVSDFNEDGRLDVAVANWGSNDFQLLLGSGSSGPGWVGEAPMSVARSDLGAALGPDGLVYAVGGRTPTQQSLVESYGSGTNAWTTRASLLTARSGVAVATGPDGRIYAVGGEAGSALTTAEAYDTTAGTWTAVADLSVARISAAAALGPDGLVYVAGGYTGSPGQTTTATSSVEAYNVGANTWTVMPSMTTARTALALATGGDGRIYAMGGLDAAGAVLSSIEAYDTATGVWTSGPPMPTARWVLAAATALDGKIYVTGGDTGYPSSSPTATVEVFDPSTSTWAEFPSLSTPRRGAPASLGPDGRILVVGGVNDSAYLASSEAYGPEIAVAPSSGASGSSASVSGSNFAGNATVPIYWGSASTGSVLGSGTTDASGSLAPVAVTVPASVAGIYTVTLVDPASGYRVQASFTIP